MDTMKRILLVEDNVINQQVTAKVLSKLGYLVEVVENGLKAVKSVKETSYDLILMDCQMPDMDGYAATKEIRKYEATINKHTPIVAMTAHALKGDKEKCLTCGMDDYIAKPFDIQLLANKLIHHLDSTNHQENRTMTSKKEMLEDITHLSQPSYSVIDMNRMHEIFGNDMASIHEFVKTFIASTHELIKKIEETLQSKNVSSAKIAFHTLKGSSGNSGATKIYELAKSAEQLVLNQDWEGAEKILNEIKNTFRELCEEYENFKNIELT